MINLQEVRGQNRIIIIVGSGQSIDLLPDSILASCFIISINWSFLYVPNRNKNHICFCSDTSALELRRSIRSFRFRPPDNILSKYDFKIGELYQISKDLNYLSNSNTSVYRVLDLAYKLNPEIILFAGIDLQGKDGDKIKILPFKRLNYDDPQVDHILQKEADALKAGINQIRSEGIKAFNISPCSRLEQDATIEEFIDEFINNSK